MTQRVFLKLLLLVVLVVGVSTAALDLFIRQTWEASLSPALKHRIEKQLLEASGIGLLSGLVVALIGAQSVSRRLHMMVGFAQEIAAGHLAARLPESGTDELAMLANTLDQTASQLEVNFRNLESSQQQLESLLNSMSDAVVAVSPEREVAWFNGAMKALATGSIAVGTPLIRAVRDPDFLRVVDEVLHTRKLQQHVSLFSVSPGRTFGMTSAPLPDGGVVCVLRDITEIARVERTRRDFIANVSHELRTPLTSLLGYTETLFDESVDPKAREFLDIIRRNAQRMSRLTEDLLTLARVESGEDPLEQAPVFAGELLRDAQVSFNELAKGRGISIEIAKSPEIQVFADRDAVHQVFANLIDNALKYAPGHKNILIGAEEKPSGNVEFYVKDFGPGIPSEHLPRLFERFYRVDKGRSREAGGTGLGLAIVKHIVLNHGGEAGVTSELGHGSTFWFRLPLAEVRRDNPVAAGTKKLAHF